MSVLATASLPFNLSWDSVKSLKDYAPTAISAAKTAKDAWTTHKEKKQETELNSIPRQTTWDRSTQASADHQQRVQDLLNRTPPPSSPTPSNLPARPSVKHRNWWMLICIMLILLFATITSILSAELFKANRRLERPVATVTSTESLQHTTTHFNTTTLIQTTTQFEWKTATDIRVVTSTYTTGPPAQATGIEAGDGPVTVTVTAKKGG